MPAMQRRRNPLLCPPKAITLDIDDTPNVVHGHQQLSLFNAHYDFLYLPSRMSQKSSDWHVFTQNALKTVLRPAVLDHPASSSFLASPYHL